MKAIFLGEEVSVIGEIRQVFRFDNGERGYWKGIRGLYRGKVVEVKGKPGAEKMATRPDSAEGLELTEAEEREFDAKQLTVKQKRLENRKALSLKKPHRDIVNAIELLRPFAGHLSTIDRRRFMAYLENELSKRKKRK